MMEFKDFALFMKDSFPFLTDVQLERFRMLEDGYKDWNARINVISRKDIGNLYDHHVLHSLAIAAYLKIRRPEAWALFREGSPQVLDLGSGGGFPGIPLAILFPSARFTLCDSVRKKTLVAQEIANRAGLSNVRVVNARAESLDERFDFVVSRAVASLTDFYPWVEGKYARSVLCLKGGELDEEIAQLTGRFRLKRESVATWPVGDFLHEPYFEGKFVVEIGR